MNTMYQITLGVILLCSYALASSESLNSEGAQFFFATTDDDGARQVNQFVTFNATLALFAAGIALLGLAGALTLYYLLTNSNDEESGYGNSGYHDSGSSYHGRKFNPYGINWESLSILDWISMGQEAWEKYDPSNLECQKRLICEIHQNKSKFGGPANNIVELFGYLHYAEIFSLPDELKLLLEEYMDASERGKTMQKDCGEVYGECDFSVSGALSKFSTNEI